MDRYWTDALHHVEANGRSGTRIVAPADFAPDLSLAGDYSLSAKTLGVDVLILHKTDYRQLPVDVVRTALDELTISFANEVFIILTRDPRRVDVDPTHLGILAEVREWLSSGSDGDREQTALAMHSGPRMAATYVGKGRVLLQTAFGHLMLVAGEDTSIAPHLIRDGWFDPGMTRFLTRALRAGETFVDVGANFGVYTLIAAEIVGGEGRVVAVEANPAIAEILHENTVMNGFGSRVTVLRNAAGDAEGTLPIYSFSIRQGSSTMLSAVAMQAERDYGERIAETQVQCRTLDAMIASAGIDALDLLKIDVEGFEDRVLRGARACMARFRPRLLMEWHPDYMTPGSETAISTFLLDELGYRLERVEGDGSTRPVDVAELMTLEHSDILALPGGA